MRDPDIQASFTDERGIHFECVHTSDDVRAEFPWMAEYLWGARHPNGAIFNMGVGSSVEEARAKLIEHYPELGRRAA